jgi:hypothetical protein
MSASVIGKERTCSVARCQERTDAGLITPYKPASVSRSRFQLAITGRCAAQKILRHAVELRGEFFHCCIFAGHFANLSTVQSYLRGD